MHWCMGLSMDIWKIGCLESHAIIKNVRYTVGIISLFYFHFRNLANALLRIKILDIGDNLSCSVGNSNTVDD